MATWYSGRKLTCRGDSLAQAKTFTRELHRALSDERHYVVLTLRLLADVDAKRLYADMGYASMYAFCTKELGLSEQQAYLRINVARTARRHPQIFDKLERGELHMSGVHRLSPALYVVQEPDSLIDEATHLSKRATEELVACYMPRPDQPTRSDPIPNQPGRYLLRANISAKAMALIDKARDLGGSRPSTTGLEAKSPIPRCPTTSPIRRRGQRQPPGPQDCVQATHPSLPDDLAYTQVRSAPAADRASPR